MNFFEHQAHARASTRSMLVLFALSLVLIVVFITVALALLSGDVQVLRQAEVWLVSTGVIGTFIGLASAYRIIGLRDGGGAVAHALGATQVNHHAADPHYRRLLNVVEEMAIASGVPCPEIFVLEDEDGINAFAAGFSQSDAAVAVTRGALMKLSRDELQGVIAHEFSHVLNGDMRLNIRLVGVLFGISVLGLIGYKLMRAGGRSRDGMSVVAIGAVVAGFGYLGLLCGRLIKAHISRSREFLADASAVQFTRSSSGLAGALKKIAGFQAGSLLTHRESEEYAHMLFGSVQTKRLFDTHPDVRERIRRLEPSFDPSTLQMLAANETKLRFDHLDEPSSAMALLGTTQSEPLRTDMLLAQIATPEAAHVRVAEGIHRSLDTKLMDAAHDREAVEALLLALALSGDPGVRERQLQITAARVSEVTVQCALQLLPLVQALKPQQRLPLACVAFPTIKLRSASTLQQLFDLLHDLALADASLDVFEYCLLRLLWQSCCNSSPLRRASSASSPGVDVATAERMLLTIVAQFGHSDDAIAQQAYARGAARLPRLTSAQFTRIDSWVDALDTSLALLSKQDLVSKRRLLHALLDSALCDQSLGASECELLRVVCAFLQCPMPPVLQLFEFEPGIAVRS